MRVLSIHGIHKIDEQYKKLGAEIVLISTVKNVWGNINFIYDEIYGLKKEASDQEILELAKKLHEINQFDFIGCYCDGNQEIIYNIAKELNLPLPQNLETIQCTHNKIKMRKVLKEKNVEEVKSFQVKKKKELESILPQMNFPVIFKPLDGEGSKGIQKASSIDEAMARFKALLSNWGGQYQFLVEEFLEGDEYSVESFSHQGKHKILGVTQKFKEPITFIETGHTFPANLSKELSQEIFEHVEKALNACNYLNGAGHTEIILTKHGPRIIEMHTRLGGDEIPRLVKLITGLDLYELFARQTLGEDIWPLLESIQYQDQEASIAYFLNTSGGTLKRINNKNNQDERIIDYRELQQPGFFIDQKSLNSLSRSAFVIVRDKVSQSQETARSFLSQVDIEFE